MGAGRTWLSGGIEVAEDQGAGRAYPDIVRDGVFATCLPTLLDIN